MNSTTTNVRQMAKMQLADTPAHNCQSNQKHIDSRDSSLSSLGDNEPTDMQRVEIMSEVHESPATDDQQQHDANNCSSSEHGSSSSGVDVCNENSDNEYHLIDSPQLANYQHANQEPSSSAYVDVDRGDEIKAMEESLEYTINILKLALNNQFDKALAMSQERSTDDLYAALGYAALCFLRASLTLESDDLVAAMQAINNSLEVSASKQKTMISRLLWRPNYDLFSDVQVHAELVHAESLLMLALITFFADQSLICLVKGAFRIRSCYQMYKECMFILRNRHNWSSCLAQKHFESGVRMGLGTFNLLMSYLPSRALRILEYVGFSGNRQTGVKQLDRSIELADGLRSVFSSLVTLTYHTYVEALFGLGAFDAQKVQQINLESMKLYPNSAFFLLFRGRYHQFQGNLDEALENYQRCIDAQDEWKQFHSICHWEMMWCYAIRMDWSNAAHYANLLRNQSKWSPASYTYQYASFLYTQIVESDRLKCENNNNGNIAIGATSDTTANNKLSDIADIMKKVPKLRIRYAGKTIPAEKFAITRSEKFIKQKNRLTMPAMEFLYIWNIFTTMRHMPDCIQLILDKLNQELSLVLANNVDSGSSGGDDIRPTINMDDYGLTLLLKAVCLKILDRLDEAQQCLMDIIDNESQIKIDTFLLPYACMEMGLLKLEQTKYDEARQWLQRAKHDFTGYLLETVVHFRIHAANLVIQQQRHKQDSSASNSLTESFVSIDKF